MPTRSCRFSRISSPIVCRGHSSPCVADILVRERSARPYRMLAFTAHSWAQPEFGFRHVRLFHQTPSGGFMLKVLRNSWRIRLILWLFTLIVCRGTSFSQQPASKYPPTVVFMTDFGVVDDSVALCKGVMYGITPNLRIVDLTHQVTPFSIRDGARFLYGATPYFPAG